MNSGLQGVCPNQLLSIRLHPQANGSCVTKPYHIKDVLVGNGTTVSEVYSLTIAEKQLCIANVSVLGNDGPVASLIVKFSKCADITILKFHSFFNFQVHIMFNTVMYTLTTPPTYLWSVHVHLPSTQQHQGLY